MVLEDIKIHDGIQLTKAQSGVVDALLDESDSLRNYLGERVVSDQAHVLSVEEITESYAKYCHNKRWNPKPITEIHKELEGLMLELFRTAKSNSIMHNGKYVKGYRRVTFK